MDLTFTEILIGIIVITLSIIAIKITFSFNINDYLKRRDERLQNKIKNYCTHANAEVVEKGVIIRSTFISPSGTTNWICQKCGLQIYHLDKEEENQRIQKFFENPEEFGKQEKKFHKLLKKAGLV